MRLLWTMPPSHRAPVERSLLLLESRLGHGTRFGKWDASKCDAKWRLNTCLHMRACLLVEHACLVCILTEPNFCGLLTEPRWEATWKKKVGALTDVSHQAPFSSQDHRPVMWVCHIEGGTRGPRRALPGQKQDPPWKPCPNGRITSKYITVFRRRTLRSCRAGEAREMRH